MRDHLERWAAPILTLLVVVVGYAVTLAGLERQVESNRAKMESHEQTSAHPDMLSRAAALETHTTYIREAVQDIRIQLGGMRKTLYEVKSLLQKPSLHTSEAVLWQAESERD